MIKIYRCSPFVALVNDAVCDWAAWRDKINKASTSMLLENGIAIVPEAGFNDIHKDLLEQVTVGNVTSLVAYQRGLQELYDTIMEMFGEPVMMPHTPPDLPTPPPDKYVYNDKVTIDEAYLTTPPKDDPTDK